MLFMDLIAVEHPSCHLIVLSLSKLKLDQFFQPNKLTNSSQFKDIPIRTDNYLTISCIGSLAPLEMPFFDP